MANEKKHGYTAEIIDGQLVIVIALDQKGVRSGTGKSDILATSDGFDSIGGDGLYLLLTVGRKLPKTAATATA